MEEKPFSQRAEAGQPPRPGPDFLGGKEGQWGKRKSREETFIKHAHLPPGGTDRHQLNPSHTCRDRGGLHTEAVSEGLLDETTENGILSNSSLSSVLGLFPGLKCIS